jgi:molecular chaperone GrpE
MADEQNRPVPEEGGVDEAVAAAYGANASPTADTDPDPAPDPLSEHAEVEIAHEERDPDELRADLAEAERQRDEYLDLLRRERAEFENFRRRMNKERMEALDRGAEQLVASLLGVLDNFGFVLDAAKDSSDEQLAKGAAMVHEELMGLLQRAGLEEVPGVGEPFDPTWHEAMMQVEAPEPVDAPVVAEVMRPGYRFKDRVLRPASVSVAQ